MPFSEDRFRVSVRSLEGSTKDIFEFSAGILQEVHLEYFGTPGYLNLFPGGVDGTSITFLESTSQGLGISTHCLGWGKGILVRFHRGTPDGLGTFP